MPKGSSKKPRKEDTAQAAARVIATIAARSEEPDEEGRILKSAYGKYTSTVGGKENASLVSSG